MNSLSLLKKSLNKGSTIHATIAAGEQKVTSRLKFTTIQYDFLLARWDLIAVSLD